MDTKETEAGKGQRGTQGTLVKQYTSRASKGQNLAIVNAIYSLEGKKVTCDIYKGT